MAAGDFLHLLAHDGGPPKSWDGLIRAKLIKSIAGTAAALSRA
jgi:hypothetical protein